MMARVLGLVGLGLIESSLAVAGAVAAVRYAGDGLKAVFLCGVWSLMMVALALDAFLIAYRTYADHVGR